jgi:ABC-2 type transport system ATP-binding protein
MLQRIGLAQAILHDPELIFLDEPMSGLDPIGRKMVKDLMLELKSEGKTLFFNTHILSDVEAICDSFAIIAKGHIVEHMSVKDLKTPLEALFMERVGDNHS